MPRCDDAVTQVATASGENRLRYKKYSPHIEVTFWYELERRKLHEWRVNEPVVPLTLFNTVYFAPTAAFSNMVSVRRESLGNDAVTIAAELREKSDGAINAGDDFATSPKSPLSFPVFVMGWLQNFNTLRQLQHLPRRETLWHLLREKLLLPLLPGYLESCKSAAEGTDCQATNGEVDRTWEEMNFALAIFFTYANLKNHQFHYMMAFPVLDLGSPVYVRHRLKGGYAAVAADNGLSFFPSRAAVDCVHAHLLSRLQRYPERGLNPFIVTFNSTSVSDSEAGEASFHSFTVGNIKRAMDSRLFIAMADVSTAEEFPCWSVRNVIGVLRLACPSITTFVLYCIRPHDIGQSVLFDCFCDPLNYSLKDAVATLEKEPADEQVTSKEAEVPIKALGWIEQGSGVSPVRFIDLGAMMSPERLAEASAKLNLNLMKWRMLPELSLDGLARCRALVLGSGTLGCNVARQLLMWGVTNITLVDRGNVSFSNPVRQTLFELSDVINPDQEKRNKAVAAANALKRILPTAEVQGVPLNIHMPGHRIDKQREAEVIAEIEKLDALIQKSDVIFLLTDSREARWLPTVMASAHNKPVLNAALGFDSYVVMRHGVDSADGSNTEQLGCYFCSDVVAPRDSMTARTLDQQCTVTRPGVSAIAAATALELLAQLYNHPLGFACPPYIEKCGRREDGVAVEECRTVQDASCVLGVIPHQIRGSVSAHHTYTLYGYRYHLCTACSECIVQAYRKDGAFFVLKCINDPLYIEEVSGLRAFKEQCDVDDLGDWDSISSDDQSGSRKM